MTSISNIARRNIGAHHNAFGHCANLRRIELRGVSLRDNHLTRMVEMFEAGHC